MLNEFMTSSFNEPPEPLRRFEPVATRESKEDRNDRRELRASGAVDGQAERRYRQPAETSGSLPRVTMGKTDEDWKADLQSWRPSRAACGRDCGQATCRRSVRSADLQTVRREQKRGPPIRLFVSLYMFHSVGWEVFENSIHYLSTINYDFSSVIFLDEVFHFNTLDLD